MVGRTSSRLSILMSQAETLPKEETIEGPMPIKEYRALSVLAMVALALGVLSAVAVFAPILSIFALVAVAVGSYSLWHIHVNSDRLSGRWMAIAPLILAPLFLGWGFSREFSRRALFVTHAREFTDDFLTILNQNEPYFAHQLKVEKKNRLDPHMNFEVAYQGDEVATGEYQRFVGSSPSKEIMAAAPNVKFQYEGYVRHRHAGLTDGVSVQYTYETPTSGKTRFWVTVKREFSNYTGKADWQVIDVSIVKPRGE
jgi:hypothetical protein